MLRKNVFNAAMNIPLSYRRACWYVLPRIKYVLPRPWKKHVFYSLVPEKFEWHFRYVIVQIIPVIDGWGISCELALRWMSLNLTDDKSTLVQVMVWCRQATRHYLSKFWDSSLSPYGVARHTQRPCPFVMRYLRHFMNSVSVSWYIT